MKQVIDIKNCAIENVSSTILFILGTVFLFLAIFEAWMYLFIMGICYVAAFLVRDFKDDK